MSSSTVRGTSDVTSGGGPRGVAGGRLRVSCRMRRFSVRYLGRVQDVFAIGAKLDVRWRACVERSLSQAEGGC